MEWLAALVAFELRSEWGFMLTDMDVSEIISARKAIGEKVRWHPISNKRPSSYGSNARIICPGIHHDLSLHGEYFINRRNQEVWSWSILCSGVREAMLRIDKHPNHKNPNKVIISGCMIHIWCEAHRDRQVIAAPSEIDCVDHNTSLLGFLAFANIELLIPYQAWNGRMQ